MALLDHIARQSRASIFLVHEDALDTYFAAHDIARTHYARAGTTGDRPGRIDLSVFNQLKKK